MKRTLFVALIIGGVLSATISRASLSFSSLGGSAVVFGPGSQFSIPGGISDSWLPGGTAQWAITTPGTALGLNGAFGGGPWTYGAITTSGSEQYATVTTPGGTIAIYDGTHLLTGNVNWVQVYTLGSEGGLNAGATINITGLTYSGSNTALEALLAGGGNGAVNLTFRFATPDSLTQLSSSGGTAGSYSGDLVAVPVPEPTTIIAGALLLLPLGASTLRILRRNRMA